MTTTPDTDLIALARQGWRTLEPIHVVDYFAPEATAAYVDLGLHRRLSYFAARSAVLGPVAPEVVVATFYGFAPWLVHKALDDVWEKVTPEQVLAARARGIGSALHRVLGEPDVAEALGIARQVCAGLRAHGRPLYAAHSALPWPEDDLVGLWHAATLIREHRGDGHIAVLQTAELDPVESLVLGGLFSGNTGFLRETRGWSDEEWAQASQRLLARGLLTTDGKLTDAGRMARQDIEDRTDTLAVEGWSEVGPEGCRRLHELLVPLRDSVLASDLLPERIRSVRR